MPQYLVKWEMDFESADPVSAAKEAMYVMQDRYSDALVFDVLDKGTGTAITIDLLEEDGG